MVFRIAHNGQVHAALALQCRMHVVTRRVFLSERSNGHEAITTRTMEYTKEQIEQWKAKAEKWDKLDEAIGKFYESVDDDDNEVPPEKDGDLCDIGEAAARAFGYF